MTTTTDYSGYKDCGHPEYRNTSDGPQANDCGCVTVTPSPEMRAAVLSAAGLADQARTLMTTDQARAFQAAHAGEARRLTRMTKAALTAAARELVLYRGASKDELVAMLLGRAYPMALVNEAIHVLHHQPGENWSACEHCARTVADAMDVLA